MKLQASSIHRHLHCPGSWTLEQTLTKEDRFNAFEDAATFGRNIHDVAEKRLKSMLITGAKRPTTRLVKDFYEPGSFEYDKGVQIVSYYAKEVSKIVNSHKRMRGKTEIEIEKKHRIDKNGIDCVFKMDFLISTIKNSRHRIDIVDLKTGNYDYSDTAVNQLLFSVAIFLEKYRIREVDIHLHIIQPQFYNEAYRHVHIERNTPISLCTFTDRVTKVSNDYNPGDYCAMCPAAIKCPKMQLTAHFVNAQLEIDIDSISNNKIYQILEQKRNIETFLKAIEQTAKKRLESGETIGEYAFSTRRGRRRWRNPQEVEETLAHLGEDLYEPRKLKSPAQMEILAGKENIRGLYEQPETKVLKKQENVFKEA